MDTILDRFNTTIHRRILKDGQPLILFQRKGMPIHLMAVFFSGSRFDEIAGTSHFLEHMLVAGSKKFPSKNMIAEYIQKIGGDFGAFTDNNLLRFYVDVPEAEDIRVGIDVLQECLTKPLFDNNTIENERTAILSELRSKKSNPKMYLHEVRRRLALQGTEASRSTLGNEAEIGSITKKILIDFYKKFITTGRVTFVASGDIDIEILKNELEKIELPTESRFITKNNLPIIRDESLDIEHFDTPELQSALITRTDIENYKEYCSLMLLSSILGSGRGSRLITRLRYEKGLVYTISTNLFNTLDWGTLTTIFSCKNTDFDEASNLIFKEFDNVVENGVSQQELDNARAWISKGARTTLQTSRSWVDFHETESVFSPQDLHNVEMYISTIQNLELNDIKMVAEKYLKREAIYTAICGDYKNKK